nr:MarR family transcriptional regulator [uncultured Massilia sp.]
MFDHCLYFNTTALARLLEREWTQAFKPLGLTPSQGFMLRVVLARPGLLQNELATALAIARPTATRALDGLQKLDLVERRATASDGREFAIHPTAAAQALKDRLNGASAAVTKRLKQQLGPEYFDDTVARMRTVRATL